MTLSVGFAAFMFGIAVFATVYAIMAPVNELPKSEFDQDLYGDGQVTTDPTSGGLFDRIVRPTIRNFLPQTPMAALVRARNSSKVAELLVRSGNPWNIQPEEYLGVRMLFGAVGFFGGMVLAIVGILPPSLPLPVYMAAFAALGAYLPKVMLDRAKGRRLKEARKGLPEAIDLQVINLNAGQNFQPALADTVRMLPSGIIKDELARVSAELRAGKTLEKAMTDFARRAPSDEVEAFAKAVVQAERLGADVSETLRAQSRAARQSYEASLDEKIGKLPTTLYFPILTLMLPALFIVILAPAVSNLANVL